MKIIDWFYKLVFGKRIKQLEALETAAHEFAEVRMMSSRVCIECKSSYWDWSVSSHCTCPTCLWKRIYELTNRNVQLTKHNIYLIEYAKLLCEVENAARTVDSLSELPMKFLMDTFAKVDNHRKQNEIYS